MAVREKARELRPSEPAKTAPMFTATRVPTPPARAATKKPVDLRERDAAARARASITMQQRVGNARFGMMMRETAPEPVASKPPVTISLTHKPSLPQIPSLSQAPSKLSEKQSPMTVGSINITQTAGQAGALVSPALMPGDKQTAASPMLPGQPEKGVPPASDKAVVDDRAPEVAGAAEPTAAAPAPAPAAKPEGEAPAKADEKAEKDKTGKAAESKSAEGKGETEEKPAPPSPRKAIAPTIGAVHQRARGARKRSDVDKVVGTAQNSAKVPGIEQKRGAAAETVTNLGAATSETKPFQGDQFKTSLTEAINKATSPLPTTEGAANRVMKQGAKEASAQLGGNLGTQRDAAVGPLKTVSATEVKPESVNADPQTDFTPEQIGDPPAPVSAAPVVPEPLPPERLDYSSDREPADSAMAESNVTKAQLEKGNEPSFNQTLEARSTAETHEATAEATYRKSEESIQARGHSAVEKELSKELGGIHGTRAGKIAGVVGQQLTTRTKNAAERQRITDTIDGIKNDTRKEVEKILTSMEADASRIFTAGLSRAESEYAKRFQEEKGGTWTWLTTWGDDWEELIETSLVKAKESYMAEVRIAIEEVANLVDKKLGEARTCVATGLQRVTDFVNDLDKSVKHFGDEALEAVTADFKEMDTMIDQRRDSLVESLVQQYKASYERMSAMEEKLREENKSLWQRVYDATVGLIKKIIAFKDMLVSILKKAAELIFDIISDPIGFLGNLIDGVMLGLKNFMSNIGTHLMKGLMAWLFGALAGAGLELPETFDLKGIVSIVLQILGLTYANFRKRAVDIVGEPIVSAIEKTAEVFKVIMTEGLPGLWRFIKDKVMDLKSMVMDAIFDYIKEKVIIAGVTWVIGLLNPASAFFKACKAIYDIVVFFIERGSQIIALINAIIDSISAIVKGNISVAAKMVEDALAKAIPVAIGFLASLLGLGDISGTVRKTIEKAQEPVNKAIDWVINMAVKGVKAVGKMLGFGKEEKTKEDEVPEGDHLGLAKKAVSELQTLEKGKKDYQTLRKEKEEQAKQIEINYSTKLEPGIKIRILFENEEKGEEDQEIDFKVVIAPNNTEVPGAVKITSDEDFELLNLHFQERLFAEDEIVKENLADKAKSAKMIEDGLKAGKIFDLKPRGSRDPWTKIPLYSFNASKTDASIYGGRRNYYGYNNAKITVPAEIEILRKGLMSPPPVGMENNFKWFKTLATYKCKRTGEENLKYDDVDLGHDDSQKGASEHWNDVGHTQTDDDNLIWNNNPANYWGPEKSGESRGSGAGAPLFRIPARYFGSNEKWW